MKNIFRSEFVKNVAWISGGTAISQGITVVASIFVARIYSDTDFGAFTLYVSALSILMIVASFKFEDAIPIVSSKAATLNLAVLSFLLLVSWSVVLLVLLWFFGDPIAALLGEPELGKYFYLLPIGLLFTGVYNILYQWALKEKHFPLITRTKVSQGVGLSIGKIGIGWIHASPFGLIAGHIIGKSAGLFSLSRRFFRLYRQDWNKVSSRRLNWSFKRFRYFPLLNLPAQLLSTVGQRLPVFLITSAFGLDVVGQYGLSDMIVSLPLLLIGTAVGDVFFAEVAEKGKKQPQEILKLSNQLIVKLAAIGSVPMLILLFFGPWLFSFVFGADWFMAGQISQIIGVLAFFRLVFTPISRVYVLFERHLALLFFNVLRVVLVAGSFGLGLSLELDYLVTIGIYCGVMSLFYIAMYVFARKIVSDQLRTVKK